MKTKKATNLNRIPTWKIKEILAENYTRGRHGADYEESREELESILWEREDKAQAKALRAELKERAAHEEQRDNEAANADKTNKTIRAWAKVHTDIF